MEAGKTIRRLVKLLESEAGLVEELRAHAKTDGGRMTEFGRDFIACCRRADVKQAFVARLLDISAGAVSQHYSK